MCRTRKKTLLGRLLDKDDRTTALSSAIVIIIIIIAALLLLVPVFALCIEAWFNHTVASDITGWAAYIGAIVPLIGTACGLKWGINYTDRKFPIPDPYDTEYQASQEQIINEDAT